MEPSREVMASPQLSADADVSQSVGETPINQLRSQRSGSGEQDQTQSRLRTDGHEFGQQGERCSYLAFQDSNLSPALSLLPVNSRPENSVTEYSLFQQTDTEFAPLRAYPDLSVASERFQTTQASERESLSQHPLAHTTILSTEGTSSCSLSQCSLSPADQGGRVEEVQTPVISSKDDPGSREVNPETCQDEQLEAAKDETFFLSKDISAQRLLDSLQKDIGLRSGTSSAVSSASEMSLKSSTSFSEEYKSIAVSKPQTRKSMVKRQGPSGEASFPQQQTQQPDRVSNPGQSQAPSSVVCNITIRSQPGEHSEDLHRELLSDVERRRSCEAGSQITKQNSSKQTFRSATPNPSELTEDKASRVPTNVGGAPYSGPFSAGVERIQRGHSLWSSGNQTGIDGSYLGFLPQSQSTPGIFRAPPKPSFKGKIGTLSSIESSKDKSYQLVVPSPGPNHPDTSSHHQKSSSSAEVQSLPSLNYMQKVDAWKANHSPTKTSLFDSLALQGFSGVSPKKKAYDAVSDSLNRLLSQQAKSLQQPLVSSAPSQSVPQSASTAPSDASPRRGEAVGSAPSEKDTTSGSAAPPSSSPFGRSQSHSSLNTVVMSANKEQQTEQRKTHSEGDARHDSRSNAVRPSALTSPVHLTDVLLDQDLTLSSSQDSYSGHKKTISVGASSVASLEIDNYAPYWTLKQSTPPPLPKPRELNIDERIPSYLQNLGIDQSPSSILNPFALRGPIREAEFSPTELCTLKGSTGTPARSIQASEGGSPQKTEFSQTSNLSVDSSVSIPFSMDSLGPAVSLPELDRRISPPPETDALHAGRSFTPCSKPGQDSCSSVAKPSRQAQSSQSLLGERVDSPVSARVKLSRGETNLLLQTNRSTDEEAEESFVSAKALSEIRKLLSHSEITMSTRSSASSSDAPSSHQRLPDEGSSFFLKDRRSSRPQDSFSSFTPADPRTPSTQVPVTAADIAPCKPPQDRPVSADAGSHLVLSKSVRRTEPEGCSAAPPDTALQQPPVIRPPSPVSAQQPASPPADPAEAAEDEEPTPPSPAQSSSSSPALEGPDQDGASEGSSESSLTVRVSKLLQRESPSTVVSSTPSSTDHEEGKTREWIKSKISGQQCELLKLDKEDRERIEEIKRELLLKYPGHWSTDTESTAASSDANTQTTQPLQGLGTDPADSTAQPQSSTQPDLEAQVCAIAAREGVILSSKKSRALTSITIATCRRSTSPSPSSSPAPPHSPAPEPLHLLELAAGADKHDAAHSQSDSSHSGGTDRVASAQAESRGPSVFEADGSLNTAASQSAPEDQRRLDAVSGRYEQPSPPAQSSDREDVAIQHDRAQSERQNGGNQAVDPSPRKGHVSHVHLTLSPKVPDHTLPSAGLSSRPGAASGRPRKEFVPLRERSPAASSPDEGVGLNSPPEWSDGREPGRQRAPARADTSTLFQPADPQRKTNDVAKRFFTVRHRTEISPRRLHTETPAPVLLPYKPHGSEELFYVPQTEADCSSPQPSDTTMESSHPGSDDAVPPRFSSDVLGRPDPAVDRGVAIRHAEGIYSKRVNTATLQMQQPEHRGTSEVSEKSSPPSQSPKPSTQTSVSFTAVPLSSRETLTRDQGTSPIMFLSGEPLSQGGFKPVRRTERERELPVDDPELVQPTPQQSSPDQLWDRSYRQRRVEQPHLSSNGECSLLERLERLEHLYRLIHSRGSVPVPHKQQEKGRRREELALRRRDQGEDFREIKSSAHGDLRETERKIPRGTTAESPLHSSLHEEESSQPPDVTSRSSSGRTQSSSECQHVSAAEPDQSDILSTSSGSVSTVDTARLIRVFGAQKVQQLKRSSSLRRLYSAIDKQKEERDHRRERSGVRPSVSTRTKESLASSTSSTSTYSVASPHGPSTALAAKQAGKQANKSIQAGDFEIVPNGTRRHTRDVGTTFPSPSGGGGGGEQRGSSKGHNVQKQRKSKRSPSKLLPAGVSWFVSASSLKSAARKENRPEEETLAGRPGTAWFEPYGRGLHPWRQPLRPRHVQEEGNREPGFTLHTAEGPDPRGKTASCGLPPVSLQEALEIRRPDFISRSRQRVECLALRAEQRRLQADFYGDEPFNPLGRLERLPRPAGGALLRRAVPRKEMLQRSKQIYENLPEVRRRREEERRKAKYHSYRLNAQLYNSRITNHVLGRRSAWQ
ncbi:uncharacterized protein alms1 [Salarias fasciatus]|uniref:uncharacterized protein alms1 n=1 Tax=Salarias fasciatus TaxID=181472 RepID=UPI001176F5FA|nr:Alstrom syndrome protein 1 [Salarias fasciatus]